MHMLAASALVSLDWVVIAGYFGILLGLAWWVILKSKDTADDYFLAGRNLGWFVIGASIFASNIGSEHLVGFAHRFRERGAVPRGLSVAEDRRRVTALQGAAWRWLAAFAGVGGQSPPYR